MKKVAIIYSEYTPVIDAIISYLKGFEVQIFDSYTQELNDFDLIVNTNYKNEIPENHINVHYSLLPAFQDEEPVKQAFLAGESNRHYFLLYKSSKNYCSISYFYLQFFSL